MKNFIEILAVALIVWGVFSFFKGDVYTGFYYPNKNNLAQDIQSPYNFETLNECRIWVNSEAYRYDQNNQNYDYECGKNCDLSGGKPYVCEETTK